MRITNRLALLMKMYHILIKQIVRREVDSPTEPLIDNFFVVVIKLKIAKVGVNRWYERTIGMNDQADATGKKITLFYLKVCFHGFGQLTINLGHIDPAFFKYRPIFKNPRLSSTSAGALPIIDLKARCTIDFLQCGANAILQLVDIGRKVLLH